MTSMKDRQIELEAESVGLGARRYRAEQPMPWRDEAARMKSLDELPPGQELLRRAVPAVADHLDEYFDNVAQSKAGRKHRSAALISDVDTLALAYIACRCCVSSLSTMPTLQGLMMRVGQQVQDHIQFSALAIEKPRLLKYFENTLSRTTTAAHRAKIMRDVTKFTGDHLDWTGTDKFRVGEKLVQAFIETTGLAEVRNDKAARKTMSRLYPSPRTAEWLQRAHARSELLSPMSLPMICPPKKWTNPMNGGYYTIRRYVVKTDSTGYRDELFNIDMPLVYKALNDIQSTAWKINKPILDVIRDLWEAGSDVADLPRREDYALPNKPWAEDEEPDPEVLREWKGFASEVHAKNGRLQSQRYDLIQKIWMAEKFQDEEAIYFPHQLDFRGRVYPMVGTLNPQGNDASKALLQFSEGKPLGEYGGYWLAVHIANLFGVDKVSLDDRVEWVQENQQLILDSALNPLNGERFWVTADKPFCALAACFEWAGFQLEGDEYVSHLPIALDGSCSGLQHFSAMRLDSKGGSAVNLVPSDEPADIYSRVADRVEEVLAADDRPFAEVWRGKVVRKIVKQPAMTFAYSATRFGMADQIKNALRKLDKDAGEPYLGGADNGQMAIELSSVVYQCVRETVEAAAEIMDWLKECARVVSKADLPIRWTTPVGLPVVQDYRTLHSRRHAVFFGGRRVRLTLAETTEALDKKKQASGLAPNFVHSQDSSHLMAASMRAKEEGIDSLAVVHDSFGTHACDTDALFVILRQTFVEQYSQDVLAEFLEEIKDQLPANLQAKLPELPEKGSLDLQGVLEADFCFA